VATAVSEGDVKNPREAITSLKSVPPLPREQAAPEPTQETFLHRVCRLVLLPLGPAGTAIVLGAALFLLSRQAQNHAVLEVAAFLGPPLILLGMLLAAWLCYDAGEEASDTGELNHLLRRKRQGALRAGGHRIRDEKARTRLPQPETAIVDRKNTSLREVNREPSDWRLQHGCRRPLGSG
jgi:hypothetical protein